MATYHIDFSQFGPNSGYIEDLFKLYLSDPSLVGGNWAVFFERLLDSNEYTAPTGGVAGQHGHAPEVLPAPSDFDSSEFYHDPNTTHYHQEARSGEAIQERI